MNIKFYRGDDHEEHFRFKTFTGEIENIFFTVKSSSGYPKIKKKLNDGIKLIGDWYHIIFVPEDTNGLNCEDGMVYDISIITNGLKYTVQKGKFTLDEDVTTPDCEV